jgi:hypothetical protein
MDYDSTLSESLTPIVPAPRIANLRIYLDQGFMTIGNLDKSDWYLSAGQVYIPFGSFNGYMVNSPLNQAAESASGSTMTGASPTNGTPAKSKALNHKTKFKRHRRFNRRVVHRVKI